MIVQLEEAKYKLLELEDAVKELASAIKIDKLTAKIAELEEQTAAPGFWETEGSGKVLQDLKRAKDKIEEYNSLKAQTEDALMLAEMGIEENDESVVDEVLSELAEIEKGEEKMRLETLLSGEYDGCNAIVSLHPGAGGTEAQDWAQMLYRM
ncbi:MAG: PCRF domain-containing protein, partial [Clostridia bacterium]|nr:PCRF domain-containing protein [Clostridia bacterium]